MNVTQLREMLQELEAEGKGEVDVQFSYNYGDHWGTQVAVGVDRVEQALVKYSAYHSMNKVVEYDAEDEGQPVADSRTVILLT